MDKATAHAMPDGAERAYYLIVAVEERVAKLEGQMLEMQQVPVDELQGQLVDYMLDYDLRVKSIGPLLRALNGLQESDQMPSKIRVVVNMDKNFILRFEERYLAVLDLLANLEKNFDGQLDTFEEAALLDFGYRTEDFIKYITVVPMRKGETRLKKVEARDPLESIGLLKKAPVIASRDLHYPLPMIDEKGSIIEVERQGKLDSKKARIISRTSSKIMNKDYTPVAFNDGNKFELSEVIRKKTAKERLAFIEFVKKSYQPEQDKNDEGIYEIIRLRRNDKVFGEECREFRRHQIQSDHHKRPMEEGSGQPEAP